MTRDEASALLGAYALDLLSPAEQAAVEAHLKRDAEMQAELNAHRQALTRLANTEPQRQPPPQMKAQFMAQVMASTARPASAVQPAATAPTPSAKPAPRRNRLGDWLRGASALPRFAVAAMTLVAVIAISGLGTQVVRLSSEQIAYRQAMVLMYDTTAASVALKGRPAAPDATGTLRFWPEGRVAVLEAHDLPVLEPTRAYQLWLVYPDETRDTGAIFQVAQPDGTTTVVVRSPRPFNSYIRFGISIEPAGGSPAPTGPGALSSRV